MDEHTYEFTAYARQAAHGVPLVVALKGFADAGSVAELVIGNLLDNLDSEVVARFDNDLLLDYRSRRPAVMFDGDHVAAYEFPELALRELRDGTGQPFYLLSGYEPDFKWEWVLDDIMSLAEHFEISTVTWLNSVPTPVPHTRPIVSIVSGNVARDIDMFSVWKPKTTLPGSLVQVLEKQLVDAGYDVTGFVMLTPHYLANSDYPPAAVAAIERITLSTGLVLPTDQLRDEGREYQEKIAEQLEANTELQNMVSNLEKRHDQHLRDLQEGNGTTDIDTQDPDGDELAAEFESFLAHYRHGKDTDQG
jgi:hypothetical protein